MPVIMKELNGRWRGVVKIKSKIVKTRMFGKGPVKGEEWMRARQWEIEQRKAILEQSATTSRPLLSPLEWGVLYVNDAKSRCSPKTFEEKRSVMLRFLDYAREVPFEGYNPNLAREYLQRQNDARSGYAANKDRKTLMHAWAWGQTFLAERGFPERGNPFAAVKRYPEERKERYIPPESDFWQAFHASHGQDRVMLLAFLHLGARKGEVFRLKWADVDLESGKIRLKTQKTRGKGWREDWLPMTRELREALLSWEAERPYKTEWVFSQLDDSPSPNHRPGEAFISRQHFLARLCARAGVRKFDFHAIRHLTAVILYNVGYKVGFIQKVLRHKHPSTTEEYLRSFGIDLEELRKGMGIFDGRGAAGDVDPVQKMNPLGCNQEGSGYSTGIQARLN